MLSTIGEGTGPVRWLCFLACAAWLLATAFSQTTSQMAGSFAPLPHSQTACPSNHSPPSPPARDRAGLAAMLNIASEIREGLQPQKLPYSQLVNAFSQLDANASNLHSAFQSAIASAGVGVARTSLYCASLALILGFAVPCVCVLLWWVLPWMLRVGDRYGWEGEGVDGDDFYREQLDMTRSEQEKNMSFKAQVCAWVMAGAVVVLVLVVVLFVGVLLAGNQWAAEGVGSSSNAAQQILPKLVELQTEAIRSINASLTVEYESFNVSFQQEVERRVAGFRVDMEEKEDQGDSLVRQVSEVSDQMRSTKEYMEHIIGNWSTIKDFERGLLEELQQAVTAAVVQCSLYLQSSPSASSSSSFPLDSMCKKMELYMPSLNSVKAGLVVQELREKYLPVVKLITSDNPMGWTTAYRTQVKQLMSQYLEEKFKEGVSAMVGVLAEVAAEVSGAYGALRLHLPQSADRVTEYMGPRYLKSWEELRFGSFFILSLSLLALILVTLVFSGRGLLCIFAMYRSGYDAGTARASTHSAAVMQRSMWAVMTILACLGVAVLVTLPVSSSLGAVCGPNGNFSAATDQLLDNPQVWRGGYPLGSLLLGNSSATLTLRSMWNTCAGGGSMYQALQLQYPLRQIEILEQAMATLVDDVAAFAPPLPAVLGPNVSTGLRDSLDLNRSVLVLLSDFNKNVFGNFSDSLRLLTNLTENLTHHLDESLATLRDNVSQVHDLAMRTHRKHLAMKPQLDTMGREAFQTYKDIRQWLSHKTYLENEDILANEVQTLFQTAYRASVAEELVGGVQEKLGGIRHSVWINLMCTAGACREAASLYGVFAGGVCGDVLGGLDLVWSSSSALLLALIPLVVCTLLLSRRLSYPRSMRQEDRFHLCGTAVGQAGSIFWFTLVWTVDAWLLSTIKNSADFQSQLCASTSSGCCVQCVWIFALLFLSVSVVVAMACYLHQGYLIHRTRKCSIVRERNYWLHRYKAVHFYCRLWTVLVLDLPFFIFACVFMGTVHRLQLPAVLALGLALLGTAALGVTCVRERKDVRAHWMWLRKEVKIKSDWVRRLAATPTPSPPPPPAQCNGRVPSQGSREEYEMSSIGSGSNVGPPLGAGRSMPILPPYAGRPFHPGVEGEEWSGSIATPSDSETDTYISRGAGQLHFSRPHRHPSSVAIMDELVDPNGSEMQHRRREGHCDNGGVEVVEPAMWDSSTLHSGSLPSIFDSSSACDPSQLPFTSADEMYASDVLSQDGRATSKSRSRMRHRRSFSGDVFVDI